MPEGAQVAAVHCQLASAAHPHPNRTNSSSSTTTSSSSDYYVLV